MSQSRFPFTVAVHLFLLKEHQVLLLRRFNTGYQDGNYSVPAGHADGQEPVTEAMLREAREEIGLELQLGQLKFGTVMHRLVSATEERIDFFFICQGWEGEIRNCEPEKCDQLQWFDQHDLPKNTIPYVKRAWQAVTNNEQFVEFQEPQ